MRYKNLILFCIYLFLSNESAINRFLKQISGFMPPTLSCDYKASPIKGVVAGHPAPSAIMASLLVEI